MITEKCQQISLQENKKMKEDIYEGQKQLFDKIVNNEFCHISEWQELKDTENNTEIVKADKKIAQITDKLFKNISHESGMLLDDLQTAEVDYWVLIARYYFKKGVEAGLTNLNFTKVLL